MFLARYIERAGTGTLDMIARCLSAGLKTPQFRQDGGQFVQTLWRPTLAMPSEVTPEVAKLLPLERLKKYCSHLERGFLGFGEASSKEHGRKCPATESKRSQNPKRPLSILLIQMATVFF